MSLVTITRVAKLSPGAIANADFSVVVSEEAMPPFEGPHLVRIAAVPPYVKQYPRDETFFAEAPASDRMIATATSAGNSIGYIAVARAWNACAQIDAIMISRTHRRCGIGRALLDETVLWARENGLMMLRLETQSNNVAACRLYEHYGFKLGGYDRHLYDAIRPNLPSETALFWYMRLV